MRIFLRIVIGGMLAGIVGCILAAIWTEGNDTELWNTVWFLCWATIVGWIITPSADSDEYVLCDCDEDLEK